MLRELAYIHTLCQKILYTQKRRNTVKHALSPRAPDRQISDEIARASYSQVRHRTGHVHARSQNKYTHIPTGDSHGDRKESTSWNRVERAQRWGACGDRQLQRLYTVPPMSPGILPVPTHQISPEPGDVSVDTHTKSTACKHLMVRLEPDNHHRAKIHVVSTCSFAAVMIMISTCCFAGVMTNYM